MKINPCYNCKDREVGCHSKCNKYQEWRRYKDKANKAKHKTDDYDRYLNDLIRRNKNDKI